jgi:hypothetical protein
MHPPSPLRIVIPFVICAAVCGLQGCGRDVPPKASNTGQTTAAAAPAADGPATSTKPTSQEPVSTPAVAATPATTEETIQQGPKQEEVSVDETPREPATVAEAARLLDLRTLPLMEGAEVPGLRNQVGWLDYKVKADLKDAFAFHVQQLKESGWQEQPDRRSDGWSLQAVFTQAGFVVALSAFESANSSEQKGLVSISIKNHGNVPSRSLPVPDDAKAHYVDDTQAAYVTTAAADQTREQCDRLLLDLGWEPYSTSGSTRYFKKNAVLLATSVSTFESAPGETFIAYHTEQMSADIPMPTEYQDAHYIDSQKRVMFDCPAEDIAEVTAYYRTELSERDWRPTSEPTRIDDKTMVIFRNQSGDMIALEFRHFPDECQVSVAHSTAAEVAELERRMAKEARQRAAALAATRHDAIPKVVFPTPPVAPDPLPAEQVVETPTDIAPQAEGETSEQPARGILARQIPLPEKAASLEMKADLGMVIYRSELSIGEIARFYREEMCKLGWEEEEDETFLFDDENVGAIGFKKADNSLRVAIQSGRPESKSRILIDGEGIVWPNSESDGLGSVVEEDMPEKPTDDDVALRVSEVKVGKCKGFMQYNDERFEMNHALAFQEMEFDEPVTVVYVSEKPFQTAGVKGTKVDDLMIHDLRATDDPPSMEITIRDSFVSISCYFKSGMIGNSGSAFKSEAVVKDGRLRGKVFTPKPCEHFDDVIQFSVDLDVELMKVAEIAAPVTLTASEDYEYPVPFGSDEVSSQSSPYRTVISGSHGADLATMTEFYRGQLVESGWDEKADATKTTERTASMSFDNDGTALLVDLRTVDGATEFAITSRNVERAKKDEIVPESGQAKMVFGNATEADIVIVIDDTEYKIGVGVGSNGPADAKKIDIKPGKHTIVIKVANENPLTEEVDVRPGTTWGIVAFGDKGYLADRIY